MSGLVDTYLRQRSRTGRTAHLISAKAGVDVFVVVMEGWWVVVDSGMRLMMIVQAIRLVKMTIKDEEIIKILDSILAAGGYGDDQQ